jgi:hypothetical protein
MRLSDVIGSVDRFILCGGNLWAPDISLQTTFPNQIGFGSHQFGLYSSVARDLTNTWMTAARQFHRKHTDNICELIRRADTTINPISFCFHPIRVIFHCCISHSMLISILPDCDLWESYLPLARIRKVTERVPLGFVKRQCGE